MDRLTQFKNKFKKEIKEVNSKKGGRYSTELKRRVTNFVVDDFTLDGKKGFSPVEVSEKTGINPDLIYRWRYQALNPDGDAYKSKKTKAKAKTKKKAKKKTFREMDHTELKKALKDEKVTEIPSKAKESILKKRDEKEIKELISDKIAHSDIIDQLNEIGANDDVEHLLELCWYSSALFEKIKEYCDNIIDKNHFKA